jgi:hypothetical protein
LFPCPCPCPFPFLLSTAAQNVLLDDPFTPSGVYFYVYL